jgi:DNA polymerase-3 subunit alpha
MVDEYINRKHGRIPTEYLLPELEPILKETYGVIVYQEQVMSIAVHLAGYSLGEADLLRRAMGKKKPEEMAEQKSRFVKGAVANKIDPEKANAIFDMMETFARYGFNKSHSAAYALVAYQTAYLKVHFPAEFLAAQLSCEAGNSNKVTTYISECRNMGIDVLPPHVNESFYDFHVSDGKIVFGLSAVKNVAEGAIGSIVEARTTGGAFCSIQDFARKVDLRRVNKRVFESLIKCGAFDQMGLTRRAMLHSLDSILERAGNFQKEASLGQFNLFALENACGEGNQIMDAPIQDMPDLDDSQKLEYEKEMLGFYVSGHPLVNCQDIIEKYTNATSMKISEMEPGAMVKMAGLAKIAREIQTKKGDRMAFVALEDLNGSVEVTVFSDLYLQSRELLQSHEPLIIVGTKEGNGDSPKILAQEIYRVHDAPRRLSKGVTVRLLAAGMDPEKVRELKSIVVKHKGALPLKVHVIIPGKTQTVIKVPTPGCDASDLFVADVKNAFGPESIFFE